MEFTMKITPKFDVVKWSRKLITQEWFSFQNRSFELGKSITRYMSSYINSNRKRRSGTGNLASSMKFYSSSSAGAVSWGIGSIGYLNKQAPEWYVVNFGKMVTGQPYVPNHGNFVPGSFEGNRPSGSNGVQKFLYKDGSKFGIYPKRAMRPMSYIQAAIFKLNADFAKILPSSSMPGQLQASMGAGGAQPGGVWR